MSASFIRGLKDFDQWSQFVDEKRFWEGHEDTIWYLKQRWDQLVRETSGSHRRLPRHNDYWNAVLAQEELEYEGASNIPKKRSTTKRPASPSNPVDKGKRHKAVVTHPKEPVTKECPAPPSERVDAGEKHKESGVSPAAPVTRKRPVSPSKAVDNGKKQKILKLNPLSKALVGENDTKLRDHNEQNAAVPVSFCQDSKFDFGMARAAMGITRLRFTPLTEQTDFGLSYQDVAASVRNALNLAVKQYGSVKYHLKTSMNFQRDTDPTDKSRFYFAPSSRLLLEGRGLDDQLEEIGEDVANRIDSYVQNGSNWMVENVEFFDLDVVPYRPLHGASFIKLPKVLVFFSRSKLAIINVQNHDNKCFQWSLLAALNPVKRNAHEMFHYARFDGSLDFTGVDFPVKLSDVEKVEDANNLRINVFGYDKDGLHPLFITRKRDQPDRIIHLLMLSRGTNVHYCWIKDLNKLLFSQTTHKTRHFHCPFCLFPYTSVEARNDHLSYCQTGNQRVQMPPPGAKLKFNKVKNQMVLPLVIVADFECFLVPLNNAAAPSPNVSSTTKTHQHVPNSFAAISVSKCGCAQETEFLDSECHRGEDAVEAFLIHCLKIGAEHQRKLDDVKKIKMEKADWRVFDGTNICHICNEEIPKTDNDWNKAKDHCHICGKFRGPAHTRCNLEFTRQRDVPVVLHNLRRYDGHLIMQQIGALAREQNLEIECVPRGMEDYLTFSILSKHTLSTGHIVTWKLRFIDSFQFMASSLEKLTENLLGQNYSGEPKFKCLNEVCGDPEKRRLLLRKGVYPYEYMDSAVKFSDPQLPPQSAFYSSLRLETVSDSDYQHAQAVWKEFGITELGDYHDLYLQLDVMLLVDVFENFRASCLDHYGLDPAHYITLPSFAWDACLKYTRVELDLLSDPDMYSFFVNSIRGGISMISNRFAKANNPLLPNYDKDADNKYIMYLDANNLYGWSMLQPMPVGDFQWLSAEEIDELPPLDQMKDDDETGYILEVDLGYPKELHDLHSDYPLAPESILISDDMLSPYSRQLKSDLRILSGKVKKLTPNLNNKYRYVVHYRNLQYYLSLGMELHGIHRVIKFRQSTWMKPYILFNTEQRKLATTSFEKDFFKLLNNAVFGKSMENVRKYLNVKLVTDQRKLDALVADPRYEACQVFTDDLVAVALNHDTVKLDKPIYVGFVVLDLSKLHMYRVNYDYVKRIFGDRAKLLFTDTDSLCYEFKSDDIYKEIGENADLFDFSDYPKTHFLYNTQNNKVIGKMKDEMNGVPVEEFVGLRAKMYSVLYGGQSKKVVKGISKVVTKVVLKHEDYKKALTNRTAQRHSMVRFHTEAHQIYTVQQRKISLSCFDDKRWIRSNGMDTLAHGHWRIPLEDVDSVVGTSASDTE